MELTIGIATWNRDRLLRQTLEGLSRQRVGPDVHWQVLVCVNNCSDQTQQVIQSMKDQLDLDALFESRQGKSHALNRLLGRIQSEWLLLIDDDVRVGPNWLNAYVEGIGRYSDASCLGGPIIPLIDRPLGPHGTFLLAQYPGVFGHLQFEEDKPMALPDVTAYGGNMALRLRDVPEEGFDPKRGMFGTGRVAGEDVAMIRRILEAGGRGYLLAGAVVEHDLPVTQLGLGRFCRWNIGLGRSWRGERGKPEPGRFGIAWWAWREMIRRAMLVAVSWRPWPTRRFYKTLGDAAQYYGYLNAK